MPLPDLNEVNRAYELARVRGAEVEKFELEGVEYRHTVLPGGPELGWKVYVSAMGDIVVEKRPGQPLSRPTRTLNDGYLMVSTRRADTSCPDAYVRRRVHWWVALCYRGAPPSPNAVASHLNDDPLDCRAENIIWSTHAENRATKTENDRTGRVPAHKIRRVQLPLHLARMLKKRKQLSGLRLNTYLERLVRRDLRSGR